MSKKTFIITGAYGTIGSAIANILAKNHDHQVICVGRDKIQLDNVIKSIKGSTNNEAVRGYAVDLSMKDNIYEFAKEINEPIDVLINNHATAPNQRQETSNGIELQWATNVLGYCWMMDAFHEHLKKAKHPRIVNVASYWAGDLDLNDLEFKQRKYNNNTAYRQAKQANRMLTSAYAQHFKDILVNVVHPGDASSKLSNSMGFGGHETPEQSAKTPVYLATSEEVNNITGKYFENCRQKTCPFMNETENVQKLYEICKRY
ncbi:unnamed protein product [Didymodactylos carnosus]|uniref:Uncharacterized protein n=1 Tax=Didymodactylos carnosus TaxID=1234261 RepID=A0A813YCK6_9BILA|nr:unnamed protein product [Didymodactylos carnosus]CAF1114141.1 unnamed protein product [Didymodactylos carnosus]CAF3668250.1 unnamed protein product [Didymodactylos carnosus]CAF3883101.1 unnamed protein product [Didymodactylos carnosus]